jgi:hypothetical protein
MIGSWKYRFYILLSALILVTAIALLRNVLPVLRQLGSLSTEELEIEKNQLEIKYSEETERKRRLKRKMNLLKLPDHKSMQEIFLSFMSQSAFSGTVLDEIPDKHEFFEDEYTLTTHYFQLKGSYYNTLRTIHQYDMNPNLPEIRSSRIYKEPRSKNKDIYALLVFQTIE